jgi:hypothetical protein
MGVTALCFAALQGVRRKAVPRFSVSPSFGSIDNGAAASTTLEHLDIVTGCGHRLTALAANPPNDIVRIR